MKVIGPFKFFSRAKLYCFSVSANNTLRHNDLIVNEPQIVRPIAKVRRNYAMSPPPPPTHQSTHKRRAAIGDVPSLQRRRAESGHFGLSDRSGGRQRRQDRSRRLARRLGSGTVNSSSIGLGSDTVNRSSNREVFHD